VKRLVCVLALVLAASLASGCASSTSPASVNGKSIDGGEFLDQLGQLSELNDGNATTAAVDLSSNHLTLRIRAALIAHELARLGITVSDAEIAAARAEVAAGLDAGVEAGEIDGGIIKDSFIDYAARVQAEQAALIARLADTQNPWFSADDVRAYYDAVKEKQYQNYCTHHILVASEADANTIKSQLANGADFEQIARERSTDTGSAAQGGDLGCVAKGAHVSAFEDAVLNASEGDIVGPIQTASGHHVIRLDREYGFEELDDELRTEIGAALRTLDGWIVWKLNHSTIKVNPRYGTWSNDAVSVTPRPDPTVR
jgi:parvulin-like peptidyl-prolyl isomerase